MAKVRAIKIFREIYRQSSSRRINFREKQWGHERGCRDLCLKIKLSFFYFPYCDHKNKNLCKADFCAGWKVWESVRKSQQKLFLKAKKFFSSVAGCWLDENIYFYGFASTFSRNNFQCTRNPTQTSFIHVSRLFCLCSSSSYVKTAWVEWFFHRASGKTSLTFTFNVNVTKRDEGTRRKCASEMERNVTQRKRDANSGEYHASEEWFNFVFLLFYRHSTFSGRQLNFSPAFASRLHSKFEKSSLSPLSQHFRGQHPQKSINMDVLELFLPNHQEFVLTLHVHLHFQLV